VDSIVPRAALATLAISQLLARQTKEAAL